jgi:aminoglycoside phosphotransferase (APT) family kinase protein
MYRRHPHIPFSPDMIAPFLKQRTIQSTQLFSDGKSNSNYLITLDNGRKYVVRVYGAANPDVEWYMHGLASEVVPVPEILFHSQQCAVLSYIPGEPLANVPRFASKAAEALAEISGIWFDEPGQILADGSIGPWPFGKIEGFVSEMLNHDAVQHWLGEKCCDQIREIYKREADRLAELNDECFLVHGDFNPYNILIHNGKVSGILDWEFAHSGTPYMDIGNMLRHLDKDYHSLIAAGLILGGMNVPWDWKERAQLVDLGSQLNFLTFVRSDEFKQQCVGRIERFIQNFSDKGKRR